MFSISSPRLGDRKQITRWIIKVLKYWKPGFNDWFSFLLLVLRHQESAIHRLGGYYYVHDPLNFNHRPYHDHNSVTCVHTNAYALYLWPVKRTCPVTTGILYCILFKKKSCSLQARNELHEYIYDNHFNKHKCNYYNINIFPFDLHFKGMYF